MPSHSCALPREIRHPEETSSKIRSASFAYGRVLDRFKIPFLRSLGAHRLHHDRRDLALILLEELPQVVEVFVDEGNRRAGKRPRHAGRLDAGEGELARLRVDKVVGGLVPVVPAVIAGEEYLVPSCGASRDADGHGAGLAAALGVAHHLRAGDGVDQQLGKVDLQRAVQGEEAALVDLLPHRAVDHVVGMAEDDRRHRIHPVDVLVAVHVDEPRPLGVIGVYRTYRGARSCSPSG